MKVKDLLAMEIDIDVYDNVCEELGIAFCGPMELTDEGEGYFSEVLDYEVEILENPFFGSVAIVDVDGENWEEKLARAKALFYGMAGYCSVSDYDKWFKEV